MELRRNPPRSAKRAKFDKSESLNEYWEPDLKNPASHVDRRLQALNLEAYPVNVFGRGDDLIMFSAFARKRKKRRHHAVIPERPKGSNEALPTAEVGKTAARLCHPIFGGRPASWDEVGKVALELQKSISEFQSSSQEWVQC